MIKRAKNRLAKHLISKVGLAERVSEKRVSSRAISESDGDGPVRQHFCVITAVTPRQTRKTGREGISLACLCQPLAKRQPR